MKKPIFYLFILAMLSWAGALSAQDSVAIYVSPEWGCAPMYVNASNMSGFTNYQGTVNYEWFVDGMMVSTDPSFFDTTFTEGRRYHIALEARDSVWNFLGRDEREVDVRGVTHFNIYPSDMVCPGEPVEIDFHYEGEIYTLQWDLGMGDIRYENHQMITYDSVGEYPIQLYADTDCGSDTVTQVVIVSDTVTPQLEIYTSGDRFCPDDPIKFETPYKDYDIQWEMSDGTILHGPQVTYGFPDFGTYTVTASFTNLCGLSASVTDTIYIEDNVEVWADFHYWPEQGDNCPGSPIRFQAHSAGYFEWRFGDGTSSNAPSPRHFYSDTGNYNVSLIVTNGCGARDTAHQNIMIEYRDWEYIGFDPYFRLERDNSGEYSDTIYLCPGENIQATMDGGGPDGSEYIWNLGDGTELMGPNIDYAYSENGIFELSLSVTDRCHRYSSSPIRWIMVDPLIEPMVMLQYAPMELCPGEEVYFWDEAWWEFESGNVYDINFGDGTSQNNITDISDHELDVLAYHTYPTLGEYPFTFTATNVCGNSVSLNDTIRVTDDVSKKPFYHVRNSTNDDEGGEPEMWNMPMDTNVHEFIIDVQWMDWSVALNDTFYVYAWYGGFNTDGDSGDPAGVAMFTSSDINVLDSFRIYVPVRPDAPPEVGFAVGWYCEPGKMDDEPDSWGTTMDDLGNPISSFPIYPGGITYTSDYSMGMPVQLSPWNGICRSSSVNGSWRGYTPNKVVFLEMYEDSGMYSYNLNIADDEMWTNSEYISGGQYAQTTETDLSLYPNSGYCMDSAQYTIERIDDGLMLHLVSDNCPSQIMYLDSIMFYRNHQDDQGGRAMPACPGDPVKFEIAGGSSYVWHFGDGTTSTEQFPIHSYAGPGMYDASVIATNSCGRTDTLYTRVDIVEDFMPYAYFHTEQWNIKVGDTVFFIPDIHDSEVADSYSYEWVFGDGTTSTNIIGMHVYNQAGPKEVILRVTNGCGISEERNEIYVEDLFGPCEAEARFDFELIGDTLMIHNFSWGDSLVVNWNFGDGTNSNLWEPMHIYTQPDIYTLCLSVHDPIQNCADQMCVELITGNPECIADFNFTVNNSTNTVRFFDQSSSASHWFWELGDGNQAYGPDPIHTYPEPGLYLVSLGIEDTLTGCFSHREKEIWVGEIDTTTSCFIAWDYFIDSMTVTFNAEVTGNSTDGFWDFGDGSFGYEQNSTHTYTQPGNYYVCANVFDSLTGCHAEKCEEIIIGQTYCVADFVYIVDSSAATVEFINNSDGNYSGMYISFGDGTFGEIIDTIHQYPGPGEYGVCLQIYNDSTDCYDEICKSIIIPGATTQPICEAKFTFIPTVGTLNVKFNENSLTEFTSWYWNFGDDTYDTIQNPLHTFRKAGVYNVCMTAYNSSTDCFDELCRNVTVEGAETNTTLTAAFTTIINTVTGKVKFKNTSTGPFNVAYWIFGDGTISQRIDTVSHFYDPGMYKVCLKVTNTVTGKTNELCKVITVGAPPCLITSDFGYYINTTNRELRLNDKSTGNPNSWFWSFGDGTTSSKRSPIKQYTRAGYYLVSLATRDTITGCSDYTSELIQVGSADCRANFDYSIDPDTRGITLTNTSVGDPTYYFWLFGDGESSANENPVHTYTKSGIYNVALSITGNSGLCNSLNSKPVQVGTVECNAEFEVFVDSATNKAYFEAELIGDATNLVWTYGDGGIGNGINTQHRYTAPGYYTVGLNTFNNANGCMDYTEQTVLIGQIGIDVEPDFYYRIDDGTLTANFFDNSLGEVATYSWDFGRGTTSAEQNPSVTFTEAGYRNVCLTVETAGGIANTKCKKIRIGSTGNECLAQFIYNVDSSTREVVFTDVSMGEPDSWQWMFNDGQEFTTQHPTVTFDTAGLYRAKLIINNSSTGCTSKSFGVINVGKGSTGLIAAFTYELDSTTKANSYPVDLAAYPGSSSALFEWDLGNGATYVGATEFTYNYSEEGTYNVCFTLSDPVTGESATDCQTVSTPVTGTDTTGVNALTGITQTELTNLTAYPNPFTLYTKIEYSLDNDSNVEMDIYDETGRHINNLINSYKEAGVHTLYWDANHLDRGIYIIQLKTNKGESIQQLCIIKQ